jgi:MFS family permease
MIEHQGGGLRSAVVWLVFPIIPTLLATTYHGFATIGGADLGGTDPRLWGAVTWVVALGPLIGYGLLAGATLDLPDDPSRHGLRSWPSRRVFWVAVAPWLSAFLWAGLFLAFDAASRRLNLVLSPSWNQRLSIQSYPWLSTSLPWIIGATAAYGWLFWFCLALRRARRLGRFWPTLFRSLLTALGFVGSLIAGFWAATELWRDYFFDPRLARVLLLASFGLTLACLSGCGTPTLGDVRRRDLFNAMLAAWVLGLALFWRWGSRRR